MRVVFLFRGLNWFLCHGKPGFIGDSYWCQATKQALRHMQWRRSTQELLLGNISAPSRLSCQSATRHHMFMLGSWRHSIPSCYNDALLQIPRSDSFVDISKLTGSEQGSQTFWTLANP
jgi:hypothetical protein